MFIYQHPGEYGMMGPCCGQDDDEDVPAEQQVEVASQQTTSTFTHDLTGQTPFLSTKT